MLSAVSTVVDEAMATEKWTRQVENHDNRTAEAPIVITIVVNIFF